jgi:pimeloyl-ACP methyl ester carboxylesterase
MRGSMRKLPVMAWQRIGTENSAPIELYYEDHGSGRPVVLIHGFPLSGDSWERQLSPLLGAGYRVVTYDRRGFGRSSRPSTGYDYDTFAADLHALMEGLDLRDATLVGFSMGGGEVARYPARFGTGRLRSLAFLGAITPALGQSTGNPDGVPAEVFAPIKAGIQADRASFHQGFFQNFFNADAYLGGRITAEAIQANWNIAMQASPIATLAVVDAWGTDFRADLAGLTLPALVIHGDEDRIVPFGVSAARMPEALPGAQLVTISGGPHAVNWTHAEEVNAVLLDFLGAR